MQEKMLWIALGALLCSCERQGGASEAVLPVYAVETAQPVVADVTVRRTWIGRLNADVAAEILPRVEGYVVQREFMNGQTVKKGQVLYVLDDTLYAEALQQARQQEAEAQANLLDAMQNVEYYRPLVKEGSVARQTFTEAQRKAEAAQAVMLAARAAVAQAQSDVDYCTIRSPLSGIAGFARADVGSYVSAGSEPMVTVSCVQPIRVSFSISEQDWLKQGGAGGALRPGAKVEVLTPDGLVYPYKASIIGVDNEVSATTGTLQLEALLDNPSALLRPGMFVVVRAVVDDVKAALLVPQKAVVSLQGKQFLVAVAAEGKVQLIPVELGPQQGDMVVVRGAISAESHIVVSGTQQAMMAAAGRARLKVTP